MVCSTVSFTHRYTIICTIYCPGIVYKWEGLPEKELFNAPDNGSPKSQITESMYADESMLALKSVVNPGQDSVCVNSEIVGIAEKPE